jgi:hypothetical protein
MPGGFCEPADAPESGQKTADPLCHLHFRLAIIHAVIRLDRKLVLTASRRILTP